VSSTRITVSFTGRLSAAAQPVGAENVLTFLAASELAAAAWQAGGIQDSIQTGDWTVLPWRSGVAAEVFGLQVKAGPPMYLRLTFQDSEQAVVPVSAVFFGTFPEGDRLVLAEVWGGSESEASEFSWLAAGDTVLPP